VNQIQASKLLTYLALQNIVGEYLSYAFNTVEFSEWLSELRKEILKDTLEKIEKEK